MLNKSVILTTKRLDMTLFVESYHTRDSSSLSNHSLHSFSLSSTLLLASHSFQCGHICDVTNLNNKDNFLPIIIIILFFYFFIFFIFFFTFTSQLPSIQTPPLVMQIAWQQAILFQFFFNSSSFRLKRSGLGYDFIYIYIYGGDEIFFNTPKFKLAIVLNEH